MAYTKQTWEDGVSPLSAERLTHMEDGIAYTDARLNTLVPSGTQTVGNLELIDIRTGYDGITYGEDEGGAGEAVRQNDKKLDDKITTLNEDLAEINATGRVHVHPVFTQGSINSTGQESVTGPWLKSDYISVDGINGITYTGAAKIDDVTLTHNMFEYTAIGATPTRDASFSTVTFAEDTKYIRFCIGSSSLTEPPDAAVFDAIFTSRINESDEAIYNRIYDHTNDVEWTDGTALNVDTGSTFSSSGYITTDFVKCGDTVNIDIALGSGVPRPVVLVCKYDASKIFTSGEKITVTYAGENKTPYSINTADAACIKISIKKAISYYADGTAATYTIPADAIADNVTITPLGIRTRKGKWYAIGDSITEGTWHWFNLDAAGYSAYSSSSTYAVGDIVYNVTTVYKCTTAIETPEEWTEDHWEATGEYRELSGGRYGRCFVQTAADIAGYDVVNLGLHGAGIVASAAVETAKSTKRRLKDYIDNVDFSDADLITIALGVNDYIGYKDIGSDTDAYKSNPAETIYGQLKYALYTLTGNGTTGTPGKAPYARIVILLPMNGRKSFSTYDNNWYMGTANSAGKTLADYRDAIKAIADEFGIQCIDLNEISGVNRGNIHYYLGDGLHPCKEAHISIGRALAAYL